MAGQMDQMRSTQEYSRVMTDKSQQAMAKTIARSSASP